MPILAKKCNKCDLVKPIENFWRDKSKKDGFKSTCRECRPKQNYERQLQWRKENPEKVLQMQKRRNRVRRNSITERNSTLKRKFNITLEQYNKLLEKQDYKCAICSISQTNVKTFAVDHDHKCCKEKGRSCGNCVRGLLCQVCNQALGMFQDSDSILRSAINYINQNGTKVNEH